LAALWLAGSADASVDLKAQAVLDHYRLATGGTTAWERDSTVHARLHIKAFGLAGSVDRWTARPDRSLTATRIGTLSLSEGTIGGRAWRIDQNGKLQWLDGPELSDALGASYLDQEMWLAPDQGGGAIRHVGRETAGGTTYDVLEVTPPKGKPKRLSFDAASGLLIKIRQPGDAQTIETTLSDYVDLSGRKRAQHTVSGVVGTPSNDVDAVLDSLRAPVAVDAALFQPPTAVTKDFRFLGSGSSATIPMRYSERHVWLKVSINGSPPEDFLLDTGASVTVIDSAYAAKLGLVSQGSMQGSGAGSEGHFAFSRVQTLRVEGKAGEGVELSSQNVVVAPLSPYLAAYFWRDTPGVLGYDFLSRFVTAVDYEGQTLTITDPEHFQYEGKGKAIPMSLSNGVPVVHGSLDGHYDGDFRLDVGSGSSVDLHTPFVERYGLQKKITKKVETQGAGFGGSIAIDMTRMSRFVMGPYVIEDPIVGLSRATSGAFTSKDFAGNVGNRILDRFRCTFDYSRKTVYLEPNRRFGDRDGFGKFGAQLLRDGDRVTVGYVQAGSPAARAGLVAGDVLRTIGDQPAAGFSIDDLFQLTEGSPDGFELTLGVERGGKPRDVRVKLEPML
jgi:hypothetical protein